MKADEIIDIPKEQFAFVQREEHIHDTKFETKPVGYFKDAWSRFKKNKGSVVAFVIISLLLLFAIIVPFFSKYSMAYNDSYYSYTLPKSELLSKIGILTGTSEYTYNQQSYDYYNAIDGAIVKVNDSYEVSDAGRKNTYYDVELDSYKKVGYVYKNLTKEEYEAALAYQEETGIQLLYPMIDTSQFEANVDTNDANYWYKQTAKGGAEYDSDGNYIPIYLEDETSADGYAYYIEKMNGDQYQIRTLYYDWYVYQNGYEPCFLLGTDANGHDILIRLAVGARFSFILSIVVTIINLFLGTIYGAIEGYYGGKIDLILERIAEIVGAVPTIVTFALFQMYFGSKVGIVITLGFAFILTDWIVPAARVRSQFYRFKGQEYVLAARTLGAKDRRLIFRHILPNAMGTIITASVLMVPSVIFTESTLSYLGIVNLDSSTLASIGTLLSNAENCLSTYPHVMFTPALFISLLMISFNIFGNGLRDAFNPSLRGAEE